MVSAAKVQQIRHHYVCQASGHEVELRYPAELSLEEAKRLDEWLFDVGMAIVDRARRTHEAEPDQGDDPTTPRQLIS